MSESSAPAAVPDRLVGAPGTPERAAYVDGADATREYLTAYGPSGGDAAAVLGYLTARRDDSDEILAARVRGCLDSFWQAGSPRWLRDHRASLLAALTGSP